MSLFIKNFLFQTFYLPKFISIYVYFFFLLIYTGIPIIAAKVAAPNNVSESEDVLALSSITSFDPSSMLTVFSTLFTSSTITLTSVCISSLDLHIIFVLPGLIAFITPFSTITISSFSEVHSIVLSVASSGNTVAVKTTVSSTYIFTSNLSILISETFIGFTVTFIVSSFPLIVLTVIVTFPTSNAFSSPSASIITISLSLLLQVIVLSVVLDGKTVAVNIFNSPITYSKSSSSISTLLAFTFEGVDDVDVLVDV